MKRSFNLRYLLGASLVGLATTLFTTLFATDAAKVKGEGAAPEKTELAASKPDEEKDGSKKNGAKDGSKTDLFDLDELQSQAKGRRALAKKNAEAVFSYTEAFESTNGVDMMTALKGAYENNQDLKAAQYKARSANEAIGTALSGWRPRVEGSAEISKSRTITSGTNKNATTDDNRDYSEQHAGSVQLQQSIIDGGKTTAETEAAENQARAAHAEAAKKEADILTQTAKAFVELRTKYALVETYKHSLQFYEQQLETAINMLSVGEGTRTSVAQAEAGAADARAKLQEAHAQLEGAKATYTRYTGLPAPEKLKPLKVLEGLPSTREAGVDWAIRANPSVLGADFTAKADKLSIDANQADLYPKLTFNTSLSRQEEHVSGSVGPQQRFGGINRNQAAGSLQLKMPLYDGGAIRGRTRQLHEKSEASRVTAADIKTQVREAAVTSWENLKASKEVVDALKTNVRYLKVSVDGTQQEFEVGSKTQLHVLDELKKLVEALEKLIQAEKNKTLNEVQLLSLTGRMTAKHLKLPVKLEDLEGHYNESNRIF